MKRALKITLKVFAVLIILILGVLYYSISWIDTTPYFETEYYKNTIERLNGALTDKQASDGRLLAGFAKVSITPEIEPGKPDDPARGVFNHIKMSGFGDGQIAKGIYDSIYTKAVALKVDGDLVVLVGGDILLMPPEVVDLVKENIEDKTGITRGQLFFGATHTHSSWGNFVPGLIGKAFAGEFNPEVVKWLSGRITKVIEEAVADLKPADIGTGYAHAPNLVENRMIGKTGRLNDKFTVVSVRQDDGRQAVIGVFAAHPVVIGKWSDKMSGDYPGVFQKDMEKRGVDMAMFFAGTVGSSTNKGEGSRFEKIKYIGTALADSAVAVMGRIQYSDSVKFSSVATKIDIPKLQAIYISDNLRLSPRVGSMLFPEMGDSYIQAMKVNDFIWFTLPCELSGEYAIDLKNALEVAGYNSAFTSFNGQYLGYVVPEKYYFYDAYESRLMGWFGPSMGDYLMELEYSVGRNFTGVRL